MKIFTSQRYGFLYIISVIYVSEFALLNNYQYVLQNYGIQCSCQDRLHLYKISQFDHFAHCMPVANFIFSLHFWQKIQIYIPNTSVSCIITRNSYSWINRKSSHLCNCNNHLSIIFYFKSNYYIYIYIYIYIYMYMYMYNITSGNEPV